MPSHVTRLSLLVALSLLWLLIAGIANYEIERSRHEHLRKAETATVFQAQAFAENTRSTIKRLNELLLNLSTEWDGNWERFATVVKARQAHIKDITFQIAVINAEGLLAYSNLAPPKNRTDLSDREHYRVHRDSSEDQLFISQPVKGRVSGKWSIQFTRPILQNGSFKGVVVASINPDSLVGFHDTLKVGKLGASSILRDNGEVIARYPDGEQFLGKVISWPFQDPASPTSGTFTFVARLDGIERVFGYHKLPEYGLTSFVADATQDLLAPHREHARSVIGYALSVAALLSVGFFLLYRSAIGRKHALIRLRESERQQHLLSTAVAQTTASVVMTDTKGNIVFINDAFIRITGYTREEALGQNPRLVKSGLNPPDMYIDLWTTITAGTPWRGELQNRKKDGSIYWELAIISPVTDESGMTTHFIGVKEDITERKRQEVELKHAKEDAESASLAKSQFLATMSHEIRTPMNGILGMAQLLLMPRLTEEERLQYTQTILNSGNTLQTLLNDILDLSKVEAGKLDLQYSIFDPREVLMEVAALFTGAAERKGIHIDASWHGPTGQRYWADSIRVRQMLSNLISNAIKFTEHGSVLIEAMETKTGGKDDMLVFSVSDTGSGIPEDKLSKLFHPFSQVDSSISRRAGGSGLGLSIVRSLAALMHGEAGVNSEEGKGSQFWFSLRAEHVAPGTNAIHDGNGAARHQLPAINTNAVTVMVVEDVPTNQVIIRAMLEKHDMLVSCHDNGREALTAFEAGARPDLVLMDCQMPEMDGFEATLAIRALETRNGWARVPIIALTAGAFQEDRKHCLDVGMDDFLTKPIDLHILLTTIKHVMNSDGARKG